MGPVTATELAHARQDAAAVLADTVIIDRPVTVSDGGGGETSTWQTVTTVPGTIAMIRASGAGAQDATRTGQVVDTTDLIATVPAGTDVQAGDRLTIDTSVYEAVRVRPRTLEVTRRVEVKEAA
jgi:head-tail adaptor